MRADRLSARIAVLDRHGRLQDDRPGIELGRHEVHGGARHLDAMRPRLKLGVEPRKGRQQRRVHVQDRIRERLDEGRRDQPHVAGQTHQLDAVGAQHRRRWRDRRPRARRDPSATRPRSGCRLPARARGRGAGAARDDDGDGRIEPAGGDRRRRSPACCCRGPRSGRRDDAARGHGWSRLVAVTDGRDRRPRCGRRRGRRSRRRRAAPRADGRRRRARRRRAGPCPC